MKAQLYKYGSATILLAYAILIFYMSSLPQQYLSPERAMGFTVSQTSKHFFEFGLLGFLAANFWKQKWKFGALVYWFPKGAVVFSLTALYGILDEVHQFLVPTRYCTAFDMIINSIGAFAGVSFFFVVLWLFKRHKI